MIRFGAHAFLWIGEWGADAGDAAIAAAGAAGFDFLEIPLLHPDRFDAARHRAELQKAGIGATCSLSLPAAAHAPLYPEKAVTFLGRALDQTEAVGAEVLCGCIGYALGEMTGAPPRPDERTTVEQVLREVAADAQRRGIELALEACNRYETYLYNTLADTRASVLEVGSPALGVHADTYHMNIEEEGFARPLIESADVLRYVHMSESHRGLVGTGTVDWDEVWTALAGIDYQGRLVLESFAAINPDLAAATCLWRPPNQPPEVLAREGLAFLRKGAAKAGL